MSLSTLKALRFLVPGALLAFVFEPILDSAARLTELGFPDADLLGYPIQVVFFGFLYHILNVRWRLVWKGPMGEVNDHIKSKLLRSSKGVEELSTHEAELKSGRGLMNIYYRIIDNDETLKEKATRVRFNGLIWSSVADVEIVGLLAGYSYFIGYWAGGDSRDLLVAAVCLFVSVSAEFALPHVVRRHQAIADEQLEIIHQHHRQDLRAQVKTLIEGKDE